jgi:PAS domain S-box-containing protein
VETDIRLFWAAMMRGEQSATYEEVYLTMAGDRVGIEETCTIAPGHETLADLVYFSDVDITARKQTEADLRAAEERFRTLVESLQEAVVAMDLDGVVTYASPRVLEVTGYESSDLIGRQAADFILPEDRPPAAALTPRVRSGPVKVPILRAQAADGSIRHLRVFTQPIFENGRLAGLVATVRDDSELVKSEQRRKKLERRRSDLVRQLSATLDAAGTALARTVEMRDPYTAGHQERVARLALAIAVRLNVPPAKRLPLRVAAEIHDLGKMAVPAEILSKPGSLSEIEFGLLRQHPETGYQVLQGLNLPRLTARIIREHHERLDGSGYPRSLKGDAISLGARILAVADVVEAMSAHRPYRPSLGIDAALEEISQQRGVRYDPASVDACLALFREDGFSFAGQSEPPDEH